MSVSLKGRWGLRIGFVFRAGVAIFSVKRHHLMGKMLDGKEKEEENEEMKREKFLFWKERKDMAKTLPHIGHTE